MTEMIFALSIGILCGISFLVGKIYGGEMQRKKDVKIFNHITDCLTGKEDIRVEDLND